MNFGYGPEHANPEAENAFWEFVRMDADSEATTMAREMNRRGWTPAEPWSLSDDKLPEALERLALDLSWLHVYLDGSDHLSDRELYERLVNEVKFNPITIWPDDPEAAISISFVCDGTDEDHEAYLRFYADEDERSWWAERDPLYPMPPAELPPFARTWLPVRPIFD